LRQLSRADRAGCVCFDARCSDIELYARALEARVRARATIGRCLSTIAGFYRYAERKA
jgi:site-specific recombinase XerD